MDYVEAILGKRIAIHCESKSLKENLIRLGAVSESGRWLITYDSKQELANYLTDLQSFEIPFADELAGWPPAAVFENLRDEGLVHGIVKKITWRGPGKSIIY